MAQLVLGPMLRATHRGSVTVWVETDSPCEVGVGSAVEQTVRFMGRHYAFVTVEGLAAAEPYTVTLDGRQVWPADDRFPPSVLRALPEDQLAVVFGSCRTILPDENGDPDRIDALREYAWRATHGAADTLPDVLVLLGDQVYADQGAPATRKFIRRQRGDDGPVGVQTHEFDEFARLYHEAWSEPGVRWLLSTVPTLMIFDDHEIIDNWNTSQRWLDEHQAQPWWRQRVTNGLAAYWIYQHLGNFTAAEREADPAFAALRRGDEGPALEIFDRRARHGADGTVGVRWSYARDLGLARLAMVDSRDGRVLSDGRRELLDPDESEWLEGQVAEPAPYFLLGTSLPLVLPRGLHEIERINAVACAGRWGRVAARIAEEVRQAAQLSHWITFPTSYDRVLRLLHAAGEKPRQGVIVLSGDIHFSYAAQVREWPGGTSPATPTHQLVSSPFCHDMPYGVAGGLRMLASRFGDLFGRLAARLAGAPPPPLRWTIDSGPWWHNVISTLRLSPDSATVHIERTHPGAPLGARLETMAEHRLS